MRKLLPVLLAMQAACASAPPVPEPADYRVVAYVRGRTDITRIGAEKLTHINYAFAKVTPEGRVELEDAEAPGHLAALVALKQRNPRLKILLSVGGWGADNFSDAAVNYEARERFARSAVRLLDEHRLDGLDMDWEYPGQPGPGIKFRAEDKYNFTLLLETLRRHLGDRLLTIASTGGKYFEHTEMEKLHRYLDFINVMTYDFTGSWSTITGHHTPLHRSGAAQVGSSDFIEQHTKAGIPRHKIVLGAAFYGRSWRGVKGENNGLDQPFEAFEKEYGYSEIAATFLQSAAVVRHWDAAARAPYLWDATNARFLTYDDPQSLREKARYVKQQRLGGMMYWEHSHDPEEVLLDAIVEELRK
jgi:chitinase